jgi:hypothetical protein
VSSRGAGKNQPEEEYARDRDHASMFVTTNDPNVMCCDVM